MSTFPQAPSHRDIGSSTMQYKPTKFSQKLLINFYKRSVFGAITNTDWEGEITTSGQKIVIRQTPTITVRTYRDGQKLVIERPVASSTELDIDQAEYIAFALTKVEQAQTDVKDSMDRWAEDGAKRMHLQVDSNILGAVYADCNAYNIGLTAGQDSANINLGTTGTPFGLTKANILEKIIDCGTVLDENDVPEEGRFLVLPPWAVNMLRKSDLKDASLAGDPQSVLRGGRVGMIGDFTIYKSRNIATASDTYTCFHCIFGTNHAIAFASQVLDSEVVDLGTEGFGKALKALQVYGYKVVKPQALGDLYCYNAT